MNFHIITIFPEAFDSYLRESIVGRAIENKKIKVSFYNPRDFTRPAKLKRSGIKDNGYRPVDERPYGGGPGMVMKAEPILKAVEAVLRKITNYKLRIKKIKVINFIPSAKKFDTVYAKNVAEKYTDLILICGRYEGIDARVGKIIRNSKFKIDNLSIGDYVLTGGELPAMVVIDCVSRQIPGVLGKFESLEEERVSSSEVYTRPEILKYPFGNAQGKKHKNYKVPKVLLSGDHKKIEEWKKGINVIDSSPYSNEAYGTTS